MLGSGWASAEMGIYGFVMDAPEKWRELGENEY